MQRHACKTAVLSKQGQYCDNVSEKSGQSVPHLLGLEGGGLRRGALNARSGQQRSARRLAKVLKPQQPTDTWHNDTPMDNRWWFF